MEPQTPDQAVAELLNGMNKGQYLLLVMALDRLGGQMQFDWEEFSGAAAGPLRPMSVDATQGPIVLTVQ